MERCVTTFAFGPRSDIAEFTFPRIEEYAKEVDADFFVPEEEYFDSFIEKNLELDWTVPASVTWLKIPLISGLLEKYEEVLWVDADVIVSGKGDIFEECPGFSLCLPVVNSVYGSIANTGVWLTRKPAKNFIDSIKINPDVGKKCKYWNAIGYDGEMPMVLDALGVDLKGEKISPPEKDIFSVLPHKFHGTLSDERRMEKDTVFVHSMGVYFDWLFSEMINTGVWDLDRYYREVHGTNAPKEAKSKPVKKARKRSCCGR